MGSVARTRARSHSWRERPDQLRDLVRRYQEKGEHPTRPSSGDREATEHELFSNVSRRAASTLRLQLKMANKYVPLRETTKAAQVHAIDAGRAAARRLGVVLAVRAGSMIPPTCSC